jgi:NTE family protein
MTLTPKTALAMGCGGTIGGAWIVAAPHALAEQTGLDPAAADVLQGTSAGAEIVTMLAGGVSIADLVAMHREQAVDPRLCRHVEDAPRGLPPSPRMVAYDFQRRQRVVSGAAGSPKVTVGEGLRASWAIPGWMPPARIGDRAYVDGGVASTASVDLVGPDDADIVYVIAPMASAPGVRVPGLGGVVEYRLLRRPMSIRLRAEIAAVRARGQQVVPILPTADDLAGLGANFMNRSRRRAAFEAAMSTAPGTVRKALADSKIGA